MYFANVNFGQYIPTGSFIHRLDPRAKLFSPTVREELAFAPKNAGFRGQELDDAVLYGLECSGLGREFLDRSPIALSGGERRLVAIASVLSARPECVVLDEPLAGLDASYQRKILAMILILAGIAVFVF